MQATCAHLLSYTHKANIDAANNISSSNINSGELSHLALGLVRYGSAGLVGVAVLAFVPLSKPPSRSKRASRPTFWCCEVLLFAVHGLYEERGIATRLYERVKAFAHEQGARRMAILSAQQPGPRCWWTKKAGFKKCDAFCSFESLPPQRELKNAMRRSNPDPNPHPDPEPDPYPYPEPEPSP